MAPTLFKLVHASSAQQQAAFNKVWPELIALAETMVATVNIPFVNIQAIVQQHLNDPAVRQRAMKILDDGLDAALNVPPPAPPPTPVADTVPVRKGD